MKYFFLILCFYLISCNAQNVKSELSLFYNTTIKFPDSIIDNSVKFKLVIYYNSKLCSSCEIKNMHTWDNIIKYSKTFDGLFNVYFIFHPKEENREDLCSKLKSKLLNYLIVIDENGDFEKLNPYLQKNKIFHTFLLDENNKVILVGDPRYNKEIEKLFYKKTQELLSK